MTKGYLLTQVNCIGCKQGLSVQPPVFAPTEELIWEQAKMIHKSTQIICTTPQLLVAYVNVMHNIGEPEPEEEFPSIITGA